jgi:3'5'-cyclic nucleotide phosphodiesterase
MLISLNHRDIMDLSWFLSIVHNFEHASHVTMSVSKLLARIVAPQVDLRTCPTPEQQAEFLHEHTCGIASDPLTQFAAILSGLIHDLDHPGVSNGQLIEEDPVLGAKYKQKSVAEQNSVDLAWKVLMKPAYGKLRTAIFSTEAELRRFRSLLVNSIIATDIFDKEQGTIRKNRWNKAFYETNPEDSSHEVKSRKATIVLEHLIQASDVSVRTRNFCFAVMSLHPN